MLLSNNDIEFIKKAMCGCKEVTILRTLGSKKVEVTVSYPPKNSKVWHCDMVLTLRTHEDNIMSIQHFKSVEEMIAMRGKDI